MKEYLKKVTTKNIVSSCIFLILGIFLFLKPDATIKTICTIIGLVLLIIGILPFLNLLTNKTREFNFDIAVAIIWLIGAVIFLFMPDVIASIIPLLLGVLIILSSAFKLQNIYNIKQSSGKWNTSALIITLIILILGVLLMFNPFKGALALTKVIGIFLIGYSILDIIENIILKNDMKKF